MTTVPDLLDLQTRLANLEHEWNKLDQRLTELEELERAVNGRALATLRRVHDLEAFVKPPLPSPEQEQSPVEQPGLF